MVHSLVILFLSLLSFTYADREIPDVPVEFTAQSFLHEGETYLALNYENYPEWHTYWKNPGDSGLPIRSFFHILSTHNGEREDVELEELEWPIPRRYFEDGDILAYGYSGAYTLFFRVSPEQLRRLENQEFLIRSQWLVCRHICIPGRGEVQGLWRGERFLPHEVGARLSRHELTERFEALPKMSALPAELDFVLAKSPHRSEQLILYYSLSKTGEMPKNINLLTPFPSSLFTFSRESLFRDRQGFYYGKLTLLWDGNFATPPVAFPEDGHFSTPVELDFLLTLPSGKTKKIRQNFSHFSLDHAQRAEEFYQGLTQVFNQEQKSSISSEGPSPEGFISLEDSKSYSLFLYLIFAFLGGLILNIMPCVLPVISLKLFDLIRHRQESRAMILKHNMAYTLGVLLTFMALALSIILLKSSGEVIGWGFQLQSPLFVAILIAVIFIMSLNLLGLFEFRTPGGKHLGNVKIEKSFTGDMANGVIATILATPCSAPFLGTALTFAFAAETYLVFLMFLSIGLGLASPFILTGFFPGLISFLPRPGMWMENVKKVLGLTLILTGIWLGDIFMALNENSLAFSYLLVALTLVFFIFYLRSKMTKSIVFTLLFLFSSAYFFKLSMDYSGYSKASTSHLTGDIEKAGLVWEAFSEEKLEELRSEGELVFINFTAQWCVTCKAMERLVINTEHFRQVVAENQVRLLLADWTRREDHIGEWLERHGMVGIPAYFILRRDGTLVSLGETISVERFRESL